MKISLFIVMVLVLNLSSVYSQEIITDRPDYTESAETIPVRMLQIESGFELSEFAKIQELTVPFVLVRAGITKAFEVRVGFSGFTNIRVSDNSDTYLNDLIFEAKYKLAEINNQIPVAVLFVSTLPTGDEEVSVGETEFGFKLASSYDINNKIGIGVNLGIVSNKVGDDRSYYSLASIAVGFGLSEKLSMFAEILTEKQDGDVWQPVFDGGFTYLLTPKAQFDVYAGTGLNDYGPDWIMGGGFSILFGY